MPLGPIPRLLGALHLRLFGWRVEGALPASIAKAVVVAAPHTSNWDLPFMLAVAFVLGVRPSWLGKRELFRAPFGWAMRALGGIPVDRGRRTNLVEQAVGRFGAAERLFLVIPPAGTRSMVKHWKSGFYHIARGARVPIVCAFLDYGRKVGGIRGIVEPTGDVGADMRRLRAFYADVRGKYPEQATPIQLLEESSVS